jgi:hypothetical protein
MLLERKKKKACNECNNSLGLLHDTDVLDSALAVTADARFCLIRRTEKSSVAWVSQELYQPSDRRLSEKLVPTFADRGYHVFSVTDPYGRIFAFLDRSRYFFFQVSSSIIHMRLMGPRSRPTTGSTGKRARTSWICSQELWPLDHRGGHLFLNNT